ncbi:MAG: hypothetical protein NTZ11_03950 [Gammaproteobacteria bacterium]|nr:hypothetical protein [Gammaproteobacteria bacterium]
MSIDEDGERHARIALISAELEHSYQRRATMTLNGVSSYICYLDIDGFKQELSRDPEHLYNEYLKHIETAMPLWRGHIRSTGTENGVLDEIVDKSNLLVPYRFSDSWFFCTVDDSEESFKQICDASAVLWLYSMMLKLCGHQPGPGLIARGAIAKGRLWWNPSKQLILGEPLADAYMMASAMQCYGVSVHPSAADGPVEAMTRSFDIDFGVEEKPRIESVRFSRIQRQHNWVPESRHFLARLPELLNFYSQTPNPLARVIRRYKATEQILEAVLEERRKWEPSPPN